MGRIRYRLPQPAQFVVEFGQPETERNEDQRVAASKVHPSPEFPYVEGEQPFVRDALALPQLLGIPLGSPGEWAFARGQLSKRRDEQFAHIGRKGEELGVRLLDALEAKRHGVLRMAVPGSGR